MRISKLDGLRGLFSLMVVFHHLNLSVLPQSLYANFMIRQSRCFVDFFFVLSGFVIAANYNESLKQASDFWLYLKKRFIRLYPLLLFSTLIYFAVQILGKNFFPGYINPRSSNLELLRLTLDTLLFTNSTPVLGSQLGMNYPSWSISSEMISYIVFGLISIYAIGKRKDILIIGLILISVLFSIYKQQYFSTGSFGFVRGLICFNLGYLVYRISRKEFVLHKYAEFFIPLLLPIIFYQLNVLQGVQRELFALFSIPVFFAVSILILLKTDGWFSSLLETRPLQFLGEISYSIYLNHPLLIQLVPVFAFKVFHIKQNTYSGMMMVALIIFLLIVYSAFTHKVIELNGSRFLNKQRKPIAA